MKKLALLLAALTASCAALFGDPCSEATAAQAVGACVVRIQTECKPTPEGKKDTTCPAYVECKETLTKWESCQ